MNLFIHNNNNNHNESNNDNNNDNNNNNLSIFFFAIEMCQESLTSFILFTRQHTPTDVFIDKQMNFHCKARSFNDDKMKQIRVMVMI